MNVRFFAGTRAQYNSLPVPRNPLGLYFCEDTKELFWADRLLTDGMRVVPTIADLPEPTKAADGVVYYVTETRNGYVVPHGTTEWLQTIYAPALDISKVPEDELYNTVATVGAVRDVEAKIYGYIDERIANIEVGNTGSGVKAIYFAGKKLDSHDDGTFCIDRLCALRALGFVVPDDLSDEDELDFVTKEYLDEQLAALAKTDLSDYAKKTDLEGLASETFVRDELAEAISNIEHPAVDLSGLATEAFVREQIEAIPEVDLSNYAKLSDIPSIDGLATEVFVRDELAKIEIPDTSKFLTEIPSEYITESELNEKGFLTEHQSLDGYATEEFVKNAIAELDLGDKEVDLTNYVTKDDIKDFISAEEVDAKIANIDIPSVEGLASTGYVDEKFAEIEIPSVPTKVSELENDAGYLTEHQDISHLATKEELQETINSIEHPSVDLTGYATEDFVLAKIAEAELNDKDVDLGAYYTKTEVDALIPEVPTRVSELENDAGYLTEHQDLSEYAKLSDIPEIPESELYKVDFNVPDYTAALEAYNSGKVLVLINAAPDINSYAIMNYVSANYITFTKFLMSRSETYGAFNTYYLKSDNTWEIAKEVKLNKVEANVEGETSTELTSIRIGKEIYTIPSTEGYVTKEDIKDFASTSYVDEKFASIELPDTSKFITEIPEEYITADELAAEGFIKEHQSLEEYAKTKTVVTQKYEVLPFDGAIINYTDNEVRVNTQHVDIDSLLTQNAGDGSSSSYYYMTFRAYAPEGATSVIEGQSDKMDAEHSDLAVDSYGRKYATIWAAIASKSGDTWSKFGDKSTVDKYLGFYYNFHWYTDDKLIGMDKVRVILTNDACHNDLVPDAVARRIDDKIKAIKIPSTEGLATEDFVRNAIAEAELGDKDVDISGLVTKDELSQVEAKIPSLDGYAKVEDIPTDYLTAIPEEYVTESKLAEELAKIEHPKTDLTGYATEKFVEDAVAGIEIPDAYDDSELRSLIDSKADTEHTHDQYLTEHQDISHLATKAEIPDVSEFITSIPEEYITNDELEAKGYLTEHQSLEGYATEEYVKELIEGIEIPETDLSEYSKTVDMNAAINAATIVKADEIPFTESKIVGKDVGLFKAGDDVKDLTIAQILAKLLELSDNNVTPEEPDVPVESDSIVDTIILRQLPMYAVNTASELAEVPYNYIALTEENATSAPTESGFYQIKDAEGNVIESGYQELQVENGYVYYVIALPKDIDYNTMVRLQVYDTLRNIWTDTSLALTSDSAIVAERCGDIELDISHIDTSVYTVWVPVDDAASTSVPSGSKYRFVIIE